MVLLRFPIVLHCYRYVANIYRHTHKKSITKMLLILNGFVYPVMVLGETTRVST